MNGGVRLDIDPTKFDKYYGDVKGSINNTKVSGGYRSYKYEKSGDPKESFVLSALLFEGNLLSGILPYPISVISVVTYFKDKEGKPLLIHLTVSDGKDVYYLTPDITAGTRDVIFTEFAPQNKQPLNSDELGNILQNIINNGGFSLAKLDVTHKSEAKKLVGGNTYVIFDLERTNYRYRSEVTEEEVSITPGGEIGSKYPRIQHIPSEPFYIKGLRLKNSEYITVKDGLPNEPLSGFNLYYSDNGKTNILLIELKLERKISGGYIPEKYYIYKTVDTNTWETLKVAGTSIDSDLPEILQNIEEHGSLDVDSLSQTTKDKLADLTRDLIIDLVNNTQSSGSTYTSGKTTVHYKQVSFNEYKAIRHAHTFPSFSVKSIKTESGEITGENLPPSGTLLGGLYAYYNDQSYGTPILIELIGFNDPSLNGYPMYAYYYCKEDTKWVGYLLSTTVNNSAGDISKVISHVKENDGKIDPNTLKIQDLKGKLTKYTKDDELETDKQVSEHNGSEKPLYKTVLEGFGGSGAGGFGAWEGYNLLLNPDRSLVMRLIRIFRVLL